MANPAKWYASSTGDGSVSLTLKGVLTFAIPVVLMVAQRYNVPLTESGLADFVQHVSEAVAAVMVVYGAVRKAVNWWKAR